MKNYPDIDTMKQNKELHDRSVALTKKLQKKREKEGFWLIILCAAALVWYAAESFFLYYAFSVRWCLALLVLLGLSEWIRRYWWSIKLLVFKIAAIEYQMECLLHQTKEDPVRVEQLMQPEAYRKKQWDRRIRGVMPLLCAWITALVFLLSAVADVGTSPHSWIWILLYAVMVVLISAVILAVVHWSLKIPDRIARKDILFCYMCGRQLPETGLYCPSCGSRASEMYAVGTMPLFCKHPDARRCGFDVCNLCGKRLKPASKGVVEHTKFSVREIDADIRRSFRKETFVTMYDRGIMCFLWAVAAAVFCLLLIVWIYLYISEFALICVVIILYLALAFSGMNRLEQTVKRGKFAPLAVLTAVALVCLSVLCFVYGANHYRQLHTIPEDGRVLMRVTLSEEFRCQPNSGISRCVAAAVQINDFLLEDGDFVQLYLDEPFTVKVGNGYCRLPDQNATVFRLVNRTEYDINLPPVQWTISAEELPQCSREITRVYFDGEAEVTFVLRLQYVP